MTGTSGASPTASGPRLRVVDSQGADSESERLTALFEKLRLKLLDLTLRNPMLSYKPQARSKRQLPLVDDAPEDVFKKLSAAGLELDIRSLPEPDDIPQDERTDEFVSELDYFKRSEIEYLTALRGLESQGRDDEYEIAKLDRWARDVLRKKMGLPARPNRKQLDLAEHAKSNGIDPSIELPEVGVKEAVGRKHLQTMMLPENLQARLEAIHDLARLAEQEMGFSTLFVAFGFLEWYQSDDSEKACFAPLLLLPVTLQTRVEKGKKVYSIKASAEAPETNVTLAKYVEDLHLKLPDFDDEEAVQAPIERYFSGVRDAVKGLSRWKVRRFMTLGHFAFGRLAMYQDLDVSRWQGGPVANPLVRSILHGTEATAPDPADVLPKAPEDYEVDQPEVESLAPRLVHDADASQHSAIVDVMKGENLVIEGPPGTGKSQSITNVIANALARDGTTTVLFLSEKLAALQVVKRRLDAAGLGEFCLELHSEKSSPKSVVESLASRIGASRAPVGGGHFDRRTWEESRAEISSYLSDLHATDEGGDAAFTLLWDAIAADAKDPELPSEVRATPLPEAILASPNDQRYLENLIRVYSAYASAFANQFGPPAKSPWQTVKIRGSRGQAADLLGTLRSLEGHASDLVDHEAWAQSKGLTLAGIVAASEKLASIPHPRTLHAIDVFADVDPADLSRAVGIAEQLRKAEESLANKSRLDGARVAAARRLERGLWDRSLSGLPVPELMRRADELLETMDRFVRCLEATAPAFDILRVEPDAPVEIVLTACVAAITAAAVPESMRSWLSWRHEGDEKTYRETRRRWQELAERDAEWSSRLTEYDPNDRPDASTVRKHAALVKAGVPWFKPWAREEFNGAKAFAQSIGFDPADSECAGRMEALAEHLDAVVGFEQDRLNRDVLGGLWNGMGTDFASMDWALQSRKTIGDKMGAMPSGAGIAATLLSLDEKELGELASMKDVVREHYKLLHGDVGAHAGKALAEARSAAGKARGQALAAKAADPSGMLDDADTPLSELLALVRAFENLDAIREGFVAISCHRQVRDAVSSQGDADRLSETANWMNAVRAAGLPTGLRKLLLSPSGAENLGELITYSARAATAHAELVGGLRRLAADFGADLTGLPPSTLKDCLTNLLAHGDDLPDYLDLIQERRPLEDAGLGAFLDVVEASGLEPTSLAEIFGHVLTRRRAERARARSARLSEANGLKLETRRGLFANQDRLKLEKDRKEIRGDLLQRMPVAGSNYGQRKHWTEMVFIGNETRKAQRFSTVRALLRQAPQSVRALKPCFMMSPMSVAKFLPRDMQFDIVIIDEASQMRPEDALGALLRAKQIVVVGDPKQLPPTDFFNRAIDGAETDDESDDDINDESILEACGKSFRKVRQLKWHYRSRCESLIAFSNRHFYDDTLITFPMAGPGSFSIDLVHVGGVYDASQNAAEAQRVCEEAIDLMGRLANVADPDFGTIGVVALNSDQRDRINEEFRRLSAGNAEVERYMDRAEKRGEPFFVKNLENVQGDERDYVMISLTYGRRPGKTSVDQIFGPINKSQGHRRLNVLFSRARKRIGLFTSLRSTDVKPSDKSKQGVHVLKSYLEYAERGLSGSGELTGQSCDSPFEAEVAGRLKAHGYEVDVQVGVSRFRIDLGVRHPLKPSVFVAGVECDGATYHSSKSARDRDRLREEVLRGLGWEILRVWSTDWFADPEAATRKLVARIKELENKPLRNLDEIVFGAGDEPDNEMPPVFDDAPAVEQATAPVSASEAASPEEAATDDRPAGREATSEKRHRPVIGLPKTPVQTDLFGKSSPAQTDLFAPAFASQGAKDQEQIKPVAALLAGTGKLTEAEARQALIELRGIIEAEMPEAEPHRCVLRDKMIDIFVKKRFNEAEQWFGKVPEHLRQGCDPAQKRYLERICDVIDRMRT